MFSVENVKWPLKNKSDNPIKLFERSMHNDHFCRASEERYVGKKTFKVHNALKAGEKVLLIRVQQGKKFVVIDRVKGA